MKYIFIALVAILLASCGAILDPIADVIIDEVFLDYPYLEEPIDKIWIESSRLKYYREFKDEWQSPKETEKRGGGNCRDICVYMIYHLGKDAVLLTGRKYANGLIHDKQHAVVRYHGVIYDAVEYGKIYGTNDFVIEFENSYDAVMKLSTAMNTK